MGFIAEALYEIVDELFYELAFEVEDWWLMVSDTFNPGQTSIFGDYVYDAVENWLSEAEGDWPEADLDAYVDDLYMCYDPEVMESAFSDSIESPLPDMASIIGQANVFYYAAQAAEVFEDFAFL